VTALKYPTPGREAQAAILIGSIESEARELVSQMNLPALRTLLYNFEHDAMLLAQPLRELSLLKLSLHHRRSSRQAIHSVKLIVADRYMEWHA
jgi:hypothetical protein